MRRVPAAIFVFVVGVAGVAAMSGVTYYYPDASYINFGILVLTLAAVVGYFMRKKLKVGPRG